MALWNKKDLSLPPIYTYKPQTRDIDLLQLKKSIREAKKIFEDNEYLHAEFLVLSRIVYRMKQKFRSCKDFKTLEQVCKSLKSFFDVNPASHFSTFEELVPLKYNDDTYLPSKHLLDFLLVKLQGVSKLLEHIIYLCKDTACLLNVRIKTGHFWIIGFITYSIVSRIYVLSKHILIKICESYGKLIQFSNKLVATNRWLPIDYTLPEDLTKWLDIEWLKLEEEIQFLDDVPQIIPFFNLVDDDDDDVEFCNEYILINDDLKNKLKQEPELRLLRGFNNDNEDFGDVIEIIDTPKVIKNGKKNINSPIKQEESDSLINKSSNNKKGKHNDPAKIAKRKRVLDNIQKSHEKNLCRLRNAANYMEASTSDTNQNSQETNHSFRDQNQITSTILIKEEENNNEDFGDVIDIIDTPKVIKNEIKQEESDSSINKSSNNKKRKPNDPAKIAKRKRVLDNIQKSHEKNLRWLRNAANYMEASTSETNQNSQETHCYIQDQNLQIPSTALIKEENNNEDFGDVIDIIDTPKVIKNEIKQEENDSSINKSSKNKKRKHNDPAKTAKRKRVLDNIQKSHEKNLRWLRNAANYMEASTSETNQNSQETHCYIQDQNLQIPSTALIKEENNNEDFGDIIDTPKGIKNEPKDINTLIQQEESDSSINKSSNNKKRKHNDPAKIKKRKRILGNVQSTHEKNLRWLRNAANYTKASSSDTNQNIQTTASTPKKLKKKKNKRRKKKKLLNTLLNTNIKSECPVIKTEF